MVFTELGFATDAEVDNDSGVQNIMTSSMCLLDCFNSRALSRDLTTLETPSTEALVDRVPNNKYDAKFMQLGKGQLFDSFWFAIFVSVILYAIKQISFSVSSNMN